jgi:hypothetical protein
MTRLGQVVVGGNDVAASQRKAPSPRTGSQAGTTYATCQLLGRHQQETRRSDVIPYCKRTAQKPGQPRTAADAYENYKANPQDRDS